LSSTCTVVAALALTAADRDRLAAILGLLGSDHAGERDAAALAASRFLRSRGLTWPDVIGAAPPAQPPPLRDPLQEVLRDWPARWRDAVRMCRRADASLSPKNRAFLSTIAGYENRPSDLQLTWLRAIVERLAGQAS
jgi:hypothetical protein